MRPLLNSRSSQYNFVFYRFTCSIQCVTDDPPFFGSGSRRRNGVLFPAANDTLGQTNPPSLLTLAGDVSVKERSAPSVQACRDLNLTKHQNRAIGTTFQGTNRSCTARRRSELAAPKNNTLSCPSNLSRVGQHHGRSWQHAMLSHSITRKFCDQ